jgi:general secretion pathway protein N
LTLAGQHQAALDANLLARQAQLNVELQADAALLPVLRASRWLDTGATRMQRLVSW